MRKRILALVLCMCLLMPFVTQAGITVSAKETEKEYIIKQLACAFQANVTTTLTAGGRLWTSPNVKFDAVDLTKYGYAKNVASVGLQMDTFVTGDEAFIEYMNSGYLGGQIEISSSGEPDKEEAMAWPNTLDFGVGEWKRITIPFSFFTGNSFNPTAFNFIRLYLNGPEKHAPAYYAGATGTFKIANLCIVDLTVAEEERPTADEMPLGGGVWVHMWASDCDLICDVCSTERENTIPHTWASTCDKICNLCGMMRETAAEHTWENDCDLDCSLCGGTREINHNYEWIVDEKPTCGEGGYKHEECTICHAKRNENTLINATGLHTWDNTCDMICNECGQWRATEHQYSGVCDMGCDVCGVMRETAVAHTWDTECDAECDVCGEHRAADHVWDNACDMICNICGQWRATEHKYSGVCDTGCDICGVMRETTVDHTWDNGCDAECNVCGSTREITHEYAWVVDKEATCGVEGKKHEECAVCHTKRNENTVIAATGDHTYTDDRDAECDVCGFMREVSVLGDVNGDNKIDSTDARLVLQYAVGKIGEEAIAIAVADVNADNKIDSTDARLILQYAVGKIQVFPNAG